jgi:hypothetical protein
MGFIIEVAQQFFFCPLVISQMIPISPKQPFERRPVCARSGTFDQLRRFLVNLPRAFSLPSLESFVRGVVGAF